MPSYVVVLLIGYRSKEGCTIDNTNKDNTTIDNTTIDNTTINNTTINNTTISMRDRQHYHINES